MSIYTGTRTQELDELTKETAEESAKIFVDVPLNQKNILLAIADAYLDGLIAGQNLKVFN